MRIINYGVDNRINLPVSGAGSDINLGALLKRGPTPTTDNGTLVLAGGSSAIPDSLGILQELHDFSESGDALPDGVSFPRHPVDLIAPGRILRVEYSQATADLISATQAVNSAALTLTDLEDDIDAAFLYVVSGLGAGQTNFIIDSASGSATLKAAFGTDLDATSRLIKILPRFHEIASLTSDGIKLSNQALAGAVKVSILDSWIVRDNDEKQLDPTSHSALVGLDGIASLRFEADIYIRDTIPYSID